jgi:hypothetical protein
MNTYHGTIVRNGKRIPALTEYQVKHFVPQTPVERVNAMLAEIDLAAREHRFHVKAFKSHPIAQLKLASDADLIARKGIIVHEIGQSYKREFININAILKKRAQERERMADEMVAAAVDANPQAAVMIGAAQ